MPSPYTSRPSLYVYDDVWHTGDTRTFYSGIRGERYLEFPLYRMRPDFPKPVFLLYVLHGEKDRVSYLPVRSERVHPE